MRDWAKAAGHRGCTAMSWSAFTIDIHAEAEMAKTYLKRERAQARAYSQAVASDGGKVIWLAGQTAAEDASGNSLAGNFDGQVHEVFARLGKTL